MDSRRRRALCAFIVTAAAAGMMRGLALSLLLLALALALPLFVSVAVPVRIWLIKYYFTY